MNNINDEQEEVRKKFSERISEFENWREEALREEARLKALRLLEDQRARIALRQRKWALIVSTFVTLVGLVTAIFLVGNLAFSETAKNVAEVQREILFPGRNTKQSEAIAKLESEFILLKKDYSSTKQELMAASSAANSFDKGVILARTNSLERRMTALEAAIVSDPEKALAVPVLRKDLDNATSTMQIQLTDLRLRIEQTYEIYKWLIGLLITVVIGVLGMVVNTWLGRKA